MARHTGKHRSHPVGAPRSQDCDLHGERVLVDDFDVGWATSGLDFLTAGAVGAGGGSQE